MTDEGSSGLKEKLRPSMIVISVGFYFLIALYVTDIEAFFDWLHVPRDYLLPGGIVAFLGGTLAFGIERRVADLREQRRQEVKRDLLERIGQTSEAATAGPDDAKGRLEEHAARAVLSESDLRDVRRRVVFAQATDEAGPYREAIRAALRFPPEFPRGGVRLVNRVRLMTFLAVKRGLLSPPDPISAASIGQWCVLVELWPELAQALTDDPHGTADLWEKAVRPVDPVLRIDVPPEPRPGGHSLPRRPRRGAPRGVDAFTQRLVELAPTAAGDTLVREFFAQCKGLHDDLDLLIGLPIRGAAAGAPGAPASDLMPSAAAAPSF